MKADDEVQITLTLQEWARIHAALYALCEIQKVAAGEGVMSALGLDDAVEVIERALPKLAEHLPDDADEPGVHTVTVGHDVKSYANDPFDVPINTLTNISSAEAAAIFGSQYDVAIRDLLNSLKEYTDFSSEDFQRLLDDMKVLLTKTMPIENDMTVGQSRPYVESSDLVTLGALAYEMWKRQDQIDSAVRPF